MLESRPAATTSEVASFGQTLVVTASRGEALIESVPSSVSVIGREEIEAHQLTSMDAVLWRVPGMDVIRMAQRDESR